MSFDGCPFCGSNDLNFVFDPDVKHCLRCGAKGPDQPAEGRKNFRWEDRTPGPATAKILEKIKAELAEYLELEGPEVAEEDDVKLARAFLAEWGY